MAHSIHKRRLFLYGVPGVGKTHLARRLHQITGLPLLEADRLRDAAQMMHPPDKEPFLYCGTTEAYRQFGGRPSEGTIARGLNAAREALQPFVTAYLNEHPEGAILEAAFLDPRLLRPLGRPVLLICSRRIQHGWRSRQHRPLTASSPVAMGVARRLQRYLIGEAEQLGIAILDTRHSAHELCQELSLSEP